MTDDPAAMTDEEFLRSCVPDNNDMQRVGAWLAAQARLDLPALLALYQDALGDGRLFHLCVGLGETTTQKLQLREDPSAMMLLQNDIAAYAAKANDERNQS